VELAFGGLGFAAGDALRRFLVECLGLRRRAALAAERTHDQGALERGWRSSTTSPARSSREALATCSLTSTRPRSISSAASARVL
jgi:hypothetical protein